MRTLSLSPLTAIDASPPELVTAAAAAGFDATGIRVCPAANDTDWGLLDPISAMLRETRRRLDDTGMQVLDVEVLRIHPAKDESEALRILDAAATLGARYVLVNGNDPDEGRTADRLARICEAADDRGLRIALEFMVFSEVKTVWDALRLLDKCGSPTAGVVVDALHLQRSGTTPGELAGGPSARLHYAQLCDGPRALADTSPEALMTEARTDRHPPGTGDFPLTELLATLPPTAPISVEAPIAASAGLPAAERVARAYAALRQTLHM
ncbi:MAG: sugar phosphate isomerase/epimerase [Comamonadaceae bacterium]|nr:MAG: sugar phosphate isomerase/epimerase [Comamonadaceae bacterium]